MLCVTHVLWLFVASSRTNKARPQHRVICNATPKQLMSMVKEVNWPNHGALWHASKAWSQELSSGSFMGNVTILSGKHLLAERIGWVIVCDKLIEVSGFKA